MSEPKNAPKARRPVSQARIEANRKNSLKSTGPRTDQGKSISSQNAVTHGLRCETVEPEGQRALIDARLVEWAADLRPDGVAQEWMVRRAVAASVRLDLCLEAEVARRQAAAERAEAKYVREAKAKVRKLAEALPHDPGRTVESLEATAFGCDWLLDEYAGMARDLSTSDGYLGKVERLRAVMMLGFDPEGAEGDPDHPVTGPFMRAALATDEEYDPFEADLWTGLDTASLASLAARRAAHAGHLPTMEEGRLHCLEVITARMEALQDLRDERFEEEEGPAIDEVRRRAMLGSVGTKAAERLRRYETGHALDLHRALNALTKLRKDAANRPAEIDGTSWGPEVSESFAPAPNEANAADVPAPNEANLGTTGHAGAEAGDPAPNEARPAGDAGETSDEETTSGEPFGPARPTRRDSGGDADAPDGSAEGA
jgi:hypothetical protein